MIKRTPGRRVDERVTNGLPRRKSKNQENPYDQGHRSLDLEEIYSLGPYTSPRAEFAAQGYPVQTHCITALSYLSYVVAGYPRPLAENPYDQGHSSRCEIIADR